MLTIFSTPKPFVGHSAVIQRNALKSWKLLHPEVQVILFGDDRGAAEACRELEIQHEPQVRRNEHGTKYLNYMFDRARDLSRHKFLCYANCDIMLTSDFVAGIEIVSRAHSDFLMIGRRWDTEINEPWDFAQPDWSQQLRSLALRKGKQNGPSWVDYFCFSRDLYYKKLPPFLIGRWGWDAWLTWFARKSRVPTVNASRMVVAVHQNHDYAYLGEGPAAEQSKIEVNYNWGQGTTTAWHHYGIGAATEVLVEGRLLVNRLAWLGPVKTHAMSYPRLAWWACLKASRPIRRRLGLRRSVISRT